jgi:amidase
VAVRSERRGEVGEEVAFAGAARQADLIRSGEITPTELVELHLRRIERLDPQLNAFRVVLAERALAEAKQAEARLKAGDERPLLGVPIALKDGHDLAGELTAHGTDAFPDPAREDAEIVRRLRAAGAIVVGKTHLPELAISGFTESATWGVTRNPWDLQRSPGGSSGGSAAAVAAGMVPLATASDGAGSIRIPAASCGVFGLKPTRGRISLEPDLLVAEGEHWQGMSVNGCESRSVLDAALFLDITSGGSREPGAPPSPDRLFADFARESPGKLRIATSTKPPPLLAPPAIEGCVRAAVAETAELLASLGHEVAARDPDWPGAIGNRVAARYLRGIRDDVERTPRPERLERRTRGFARIGGFVSDGLVRRARDAASSDWRRVGALFEDFDVLVTPVMCGTAIPVRRWEGLGALRTTLGMSRFYPFCAVWNHLGCPAAAIPAGFHDDGMPLSVQLIAPPGEEGRLLSLAAQLEAERPWADARPPIS